MNHPAIQVRGLGKTYRLQGSRPVYRTLREEMARWLSHKSVQVRRSEEKVFDALDDVTFSVQTGEVLGVIGRNGAGKSTLLKLLSRITRPTRGEADIYGRLGSLLEIGTGFHPELTGRENIFFSGALLGMKRAEIRRRFDDIVGFAEVKKAVRQFVYNLNVPSRWGQSPFTNITLDIVVPEDLASQWPTYQDRHLFEKLSHREDLLEKAKQRDFTIKALTDLRYSHFTPEMELINLAYYEVMTEGDSHGQPFTFPIPTVNITEDFDWNSKVAGAIFENTAKVGSSYFQNFVGSQYKTDEHGNRVANPDAYQPGAVRSMCCRLQLDLRELLKRGNGLFGSAEMTGSIGVVTLNMARLGHRFTGNWQGLLTETERLMDISRDSLEAKRRFIQQQYDRGLYPYTKRYLRGFMNHFSTIGVNGINEMLLNFTRGATDVTSEQGRRMAAEVLEHIRTRLKAYQEETGHLYNLEATPAEGTTYRFAKEDIKRFPDILQAGTEANIYYTNSSQIPVGHTDDPFEALDLQDDLQGKYTGGTVLHLYMSEKLTDGETCKQLVKTVLQNYRLPYITITPVFSVCQEHGYLSGEHHSCPHCGQTTEVWTRVMGYYRPVSSFNLGKKGEHRGRKHFTEDKATQTSLKLNVA